MKSFITYVCCFVIVVSSLVLGGSLFSKHVISETLLESAVTQISIEDKLNEVFANLNIPDIGIAEEVNNIVTEIASDPEVSEEINLYTDAILQDIVNDSESEVTSNLNQVLKDKVKTYNDTLVALSQGLLTSDAINSAVDEAIDVVDVQAQYDALLSELKTNFSPTEKLIIRMVNILRNDICTFASLALMVVCTLVVLLFNLTYLTGLTYAAISYFLAFIFMLAARFGVPIIMNIAFERALSMHEIEVDVTPLTGLCVVYLVIFVACVVVKLIHNKVVSE